eukprot:2256974-Pleurochrysis_carterae.AAC.1
MPLGSSASPGMLVGLPSMVPMVVCRFFGDSFKSSIEPPMANPEICCRRLRGASNEMRDPVALRRLRKVRRVCLVG